MRLVKNHTDALLGLGDDHTIKAIKSSIADNTVRGWSAFDHDGNEIASDGVPDTLTAVCSNALDLASAIGRELDETAIRPSITYLKGTQEIHTSTVGAANLLVLRDKAGGFGKGV